MQDELRALRLHTPSSRIQHWVHIVLLLGMAAAIALAADFASAINSALADGREQKLDQVEITFAEGSTLDQEFAAAMKKAIVVWGGGDWNERLSRCVSAGAASITKGMKAGVIKHGFKNDAVFWKVSPEDGESYLRVFNSCMEAPSSEKLAEWASEATEGSAAGLAPEAPSTVMSLEEAKLVTAGLAKEIFIPPPRSIRDITRILEGKREESLAETERLRANADAAPPDTTDPEVLFKFYWVRAQAAQLVGRSRQEIEDYRSAVKHGRKSYALGQIRNTAFVRTLTGAVSAERRIGSALRAKELLEEATSVAAQSEYPEEEQLINSILLTLYYLYRDDIENAEKWLGKVKAAWSKQQKNRPYWTVVAWNELQSNIWATEARLLTVTGKLEAGEVLYRKAIDNFRPHKNVPNYTDHLIPKLNLRVYLFILQALSENLIHQGRPLEAEIICREMLSESIKAFGRYSNVTADATTGFAWALLEQGRFDEAETLAKTTLEIWQTIEAPPSSISLQETHRLLSDILVLSEDWKGATDLYADIERGLADDPESRNKLLNQNPSYALTLFHSGPVDLARAILEQSHQAKRGALGNQHPETAELGALLAIMEQAAGEQEQALLNFRSTVPILLSRSRRFRDDDTPGTVHEARLALILEHYIGLLADLYAENPAGTTAQEHLSEAFQLADQARGRALQGALDKSSARAAARDPELAALMRREQDAMQQRGALRRLLSDYLAQPTDEQDREVVENLKTNIDRLGAAHTVVMEEVEKRFPDYAGLINPKPAPLEAVQQTLLPGEALIVTYVGEERTYVWAVPHEGNAAFAAAEIGHEDLGDTVALLRSALEPNAATLGDIPDFDLVDAYGLYKKLLKPIEAGWKDAKNLLVVAHGPLGYLPFSLLPTEAATLRPEQGALFANYREVPWLVRSHAVTVLPSAASLKTLRGLPPGPADRKAFAGFADPWFSEAQAAEAKAEAEKSTQVAALTSRGLRTRGLPVRLRAVPRTAELDSAELARLPRLPDTADEVLSIAQALDADLTTDVFLGPRANEDAVKTMDLSGVKVIAFATHGLVPGDLNGLTQPALALSSPKVAGGKGDGLLTMGEILGLKLDAEWVVLSACNTGSGEGAGAEAVSGLGRAFFYAGTRALLVSNWPVETTSAKILTTDLFKRQAANDNLTRAEALRQSMLSLIDGPGYVDPKTGKMVFSYAHPIFWSPFSLIGDGGLRTH